MSGEVRPGGAACAAVEDYLEEVTARLPGTMRARARVVAELRSGLLDAGDAHRSAGMATAEADRAAIREFGDPVQIAGGFTADIAIRQARRAALALLLTGPIVGALWIAAGSTSHLVWPWHWQHLTPASGLIVSWLALMIAVTASGATFGIATTGRLTRWLLPRPRRASAAVAAAGFGAVGADGLGLALLAAVLTASPGRLSPVPAAAAAASGLVRLVLARRAACQCVAIRASLT